MAHLLPLPGSLPKAQLTEKDRLIKTFKASTCMKIGWCLESCDHPFKHVGIPESKFLTIFSISNKLSHQYSCNVDRKAQIADTIENDDVKTTANYQESLISQK